MTVVNQDDDLISFEAVREAHIMIQSQSLQNNKGSAASGQLVDASISEGMNTFGSSNQSPESFGFRWQKKAFGYPVESWAWPSALFALHFSPMTRFVSG